MALQRLDEPVNLAFPKQTPLEDVFQFLKTAAQTPDGAGLPIYIDPDVQGKFKDLVQIDLQGVPLRTTLSLLLNQVGLTWSVQDGLLIIATHEKIQRIFHLMSQFTKGPFPFPAGARPLVRTPEMLRKSSALTCRFRKGRRWRTSSRRSVKRPRARTARRSQSTSVLRYATSIQRLG